MQRALLLLALVSLVSCAESAHAGDVVDLLHPGSRAAIALGGDPFASPLDPGGGLWPETDVFRAPALRLDAAASDPLGGVASGVAGRLSGSTAASRLVMPQRLGGHAYALTAELAAPRWNGAWSAPSGSVSLGGPESRLALEAFAPEVLPGLSMQARLPLGTTAGEPGASRSAAAIQYRRAAFSLQGHWSLQRRPEILHSDLYAEPIDAPLNLRSERFGIDGRIAPSPLWAVEGMFARVHDRPLYAVDGTPGYQLAPGGAGRVGQASVSFGPVSKRALGRWTERTRDLNGRAYLDGDLFARLNYGRIRLRSWLFAAELGSPSRTRVVMEFERAQAAISARGEVESWPFTSGLVALLGARRVGYATAAAQWSRLARRCGVPSPLLARPLGRSQCIRHSAHRHARVLAADPVRASVAPMTERTASPSIAPSWARSRSAAGWPRAEPRFRSAFGSSWPRTFSAAHRAAHRGAAPSPAPEPAPEAGASPARWPGGTLADLSITLWF